MGNDAPETACTEFFITQDAQYTADRRTARKDALNALPKRDLFEADTRGASLFAARMVIPDGVVSALPGRHRDVRGWWSESHEAERTTR